MQRQVFLLAFAMFFGHGAFWTYVFNALHSTPVPCRVTRVLERLFAAIAAAPLLALPFWASGFESLRGTPLFDGYAYFCWVIGAFTLVSWVQRQTHRDSRNGLLSQASETHRPRGDGEPPLLAKGWQRFAGTWFGESEWFVVERKEIAVPALPRSWDGLRVAHLSDFHLTGRIKKPFYDRVVDETLKLNADLIVVTGDIIENVDCEAWLESTLARLEAPLGVYFVLGNHDLRMPDLGSLRERLESDGWIDVGGRVAQQPTERGLLTLLGNERPWIGPPAKLESPLDSEQDELRIGLLHSPDAFAWAIRSHCQIAFAGHTHGGQIRLPLIGPMICPSWYGCRFTEGLFRWQRTVMHITRGVGAMHPVRYRCPPEVSLVTLREASSAS